MLRCLKLSGNYELAKADGAYATLFSNMNRSQALEFNSDVVTGEEDYLNENPSTTNVLTMLGRHCPGLKSCRLRGPFELLEPQAEPGVIFSNLRISG
ncbi:hypothetical protein K470DRAFT_296823 [Piedraia hortae CBS 480.64]|uniref:Uncharacterized protein n=1 Tax=Piedraia hortae CBS 480.64 TaxID=1314780 RepID=A0A6A7BSX8_9PEZI|nr:hypothetical protein K470DRAFT_296823 [Piedraia hortae CBS 480.64]